MTYDGSVVGRRALSPRTSAGLKISWHGSYSEYQGETTLPQEQATAESGGNNTYQLVTVGIPFEIFLKCREQLCLAAQAGPTLQWSAYESFASRSNTSTAQPSGADESQDSRIGLGAEASLGFRWFFRPHLALATDYSLAITYNSNESTTDQKTSGFDRPGGYRNKTWSVSARTMFAGVGLEAWF